LASDTVEEAARLMKQEDVGPIPVVQDHQGKKLVGIVTDRDLVVKVLAAGREAKRTKLEDVMTRNPVTCREDDDVDGCIRAMSEHQVRRMPIVDKNNCIVGIVAQADIATRVDEPERTAEMVERISE
jgi:CBS domain-containing protein